MIKPSARIFPIGFIISVDTPNFNPHEFYIDGNWERIKGRVIVGVDEAQTEFNVTGKTGGAKTHTLTIEEMPYHNHKGYLSNGTMTGITQAAHGGYNSAQATQDIQSVGGGKAHNNLPPYQTAFVWKLIS